MNEEMMNMEAMEAKEAEYEVIPYESDEPAFNEECESGIGSIALLAVAGVAVGAAAFAIAKKDKIKAKLEERKIKKLEKKGYVVIRPDELVEAEAEVSEEDESEEEA